METSKNLRQETFEKRTKSFREALGLLIANFSPRSQEIIISRFGIEGEKPMTLEEIGKKYGITRERVRQVIKEVFRKVKDKKEDSIIKDVETDVNFTLAKNNGIMSEEALLEALGNADKKEKGAIKFFLECLENISSEKVEGQLKQSYLLSCFSLNEWKKVKSFAIEVLQESKEPLEEKELLEKLSGKLDDKIEKEVLLDYLAVSEEIKKNNFGKWGLSEWKEITPKGTREKAFLVLKEAGKPLHFKEIANRIDKYSLNKKKTHPQTVHNELIKDKKFILVGRGIYALSQWGYKKGTVKDVLEEILKKSSKPLTREEILQEVLKVRQVKKSTIVINLNNFFKKNQSGQYTLKK